MLLSAGSNLTVPLEKIPVKVEQESRAHVPPPSASPSHHAASKKKPKPKKLASIEECLAKVNVRMWTLDHGFRN